MVTTIPRLPDAADWSMIELRVGLAVAARHIRNLIWRWHRLAFRWDLDEEVLPLRRWKHVRSVIKQHLIVELDFWNLPQGFM